MKKFIFIFFLFSLPEVKVSAEPWLSNRYAQNCTSCHAPSRKNVMPKKRRCTLSCQGCHVNPNGGGLRNFYGKWTTDRWLRTKASPHAKNEEKPLPWFAQSYTSNEVAKKIFYTLKGDKKPAHPSIIPQARRKKIKIAKLLKKTTPLRKKEGKVLQTEMDFKSKIAEEFYERDNGDESWTQLAKTKEEFEKNIPENDPYFLKKKNKFNVGLDMRLAGLSELSKEPESSTKRQTFWPMALDIGLQYKPRPDDEGFLGKLSFVSETRYLNGPTKNDPEFLVTNSAKARSAYMMVDDLPYNMYFMHGIYKPMFEHYTPDHNSLAQKIMYQGTAYLTTFKTTSIGLAPNVPFFNIHYIMPSRSASYSQEEGLVANLGARWVTYGLSLVYSYWSTKNKNTGYSTNAHSVHGGLRLGRYIFNAEGLSIERETTSLDRGFIYTLENRIKLFGESYLEFIYDAANTTTSLQEGEATGIYAGYKVFALPGVEWSLGYRQSEETPKSGTSTKSTTAETQAHFFF